MDSTILGKVKYPATHLKKVNHLGQDKLLISYRGFFQTLLDDITHVKFELVDVKDHSSHIFSIPIDTIFSEYNGKFMYILNDFYIYDNSLYLLIDKSLLVFDISDFENIKFVQKSQLEERYKWFKMTSENIGIFIKIEDEKYMKPNGEIQELNIINKTHLIKKVLFHFDGAPYLRTDNSFFSDLTREIAIGNATNPLITYFNQNDVAKQRTISLINSTVFSYETDSSKLKFDKNFFNSLYSTDTMNYHYQTANVGDDVILMGRSLNKSKAPHLLDIYMLEKKNWEYKKTTLDGVYNYRKFPEISKKESDIMFDPIYGVKDRCFIGNKLYQVTSTYTMETRLDGTYFNIPEIRQKELETNNNSFGYHFSIYEYEIR